MKPPKTPPRHPPTPPPPPAAAPPPFPPDNQDVSRLSKAFFTKLKRWVGGVGGDGGSKKEKKKGSATVTCTHARPRARAPELARLSGKLDLKADNF